MKKELYVFNGAGRAAAYGIGTYIEQLKKALKDADLNLTIVYLYAQGNEIQISEKEGYKQISIPFPAGNQTNIRQYYAKIIAYILKDLIPVDKKVEYIFHLNFMTDSYLVKCLKKHFRCKTILTVHYTDWSFSLNGDVRKLKKLLQKPEKELKKNAQERLIVKGFKEDVKMIGRVDRLVCVARHTWEIFHTIGAVDEGKTEIINNALEDTRKILSSKNKSDLRMKYHLDENTRIILFAGRLDEVKGIAWLIRAFRKVLITNPDTRLFLIGDGNFSAWLKESADIWTQVTFTGLIEKEKLYELYSVADIGVVCSLHEEFGFVAIEMMMHSLPVIVTKTGGLDEIVEDWVSGLKVSVRTIQEKRQADVKQLEEKICFLLNNPADAQKLGENGRRRFLERYELSGFKEKMLNLYDKL